LIAIGSGNASVAKRTGESNLRVLDTLGRRRSLQASPVARVEHFAFSSLYGVKFTSSFRLSAVVDLGSLVTFAFHTNREGGNKRHSACHAMLSHSRELADACLLSVIRESRGSRGAATIVSAMGSSVLSLSSCASCVLRRFFAVAIDPVLGCSSSSRFSRVAPKMR
jgi:hypothetical protein